MNTRYLITGVILVGVLVAGVFILRKNQPAIPTTHISSSQAKSKGPVDAPIQIHEYSDFQCPACMKALPVMNDLMTKFSNQIYFVFHHFPLESHNLSLIAHQAAECAAEQNQFWAFHDELYTQQAQWSFVSDPTEQFLRYAKKSEVNLDIFAKCLADPAVKRRILTERKESERLRISSTPTFFINGERVLGAVELKIKGEPMIQEKLSGLWQSKSAVNPETNPVASSQ